MYNSYEAVFGTKGVDDLADIGLAIAVVYWRSLRPDVV